MQLSRSDLHGTAQRGAFAFTALPPPDLSRGISLYGGRVCRWGGGPEPRKTLGVVENRRRVPKTPLRSPALPARWASPPKIAGYASGQSPYSDCQQNAEHVTCWAPMNPRGPSF